VLPIASGTGLRGDYYSDGYDEADAFIPAYFKMTRTDATVNFPDFGHHAPALGVGPTLFATRWTGQIEPKYSELYTFTTDADDGVRLWVNGQLLIDHWVRNQAEVNQGTIQLIAGQRVDIRLEYFQLHGDARCVLSWSSPSQAKEIVPQSRLYPTVVDVPPTVSLAASVSPSTTASTSAFSTDTLALSASASNPSGTVASVSFYCNGVLLGTSTASPSILSWKPNRIGICQLTAVAVDSFGGATVSDPVMITVARTGRVQVLAP
jgi:hypothetical protein